MKNFRMMLVGILVSAAAFLTGQPTQAASIDNGSFMSLWNTYSQCQSTTDLYQMREAALTLTNAANGSHNQESFVLPLPGNLEQFVSTPAPRFAVDVKAMAAACSLRAGSTAVVAGKINVAKDLLKTVLNYQPQPEYAYYVLQAKTLLSELETNTVQVTLNIP